MENNQNYLKIVLERKQVQVFQDRLEYGYDVIELLTNKVTMANLILILVYCYTVVHTSDLIRAI